ncbi:MAG: Ig domain-containing protein, partial [Planctomycetota bacterium]
MPKFHYWVLFFALGVLIGAGCADSVGDKPAVYAVSSPSLPGGKAGEVYSADLGVQGGVAPHTWRISDGALPKGLVLSASGKITGKPAEGCNPSFT